MSTVRVQERDAAMERLWAVEARARREDASEVLDAARSAILVLERVIASADGGGDPLELGRTFRYLGDAYFSASAKKDASALCRAREAYLRGEPLLDAADAALERAKLDFHCAHTTRLLESGRNLALLVEARQRYDAAMRVFLAELPSYVPHVQDSLQSLEIRIRGVELLENAQRRYLVHDQE